MSCERHDSRRGSSVNAALAILLSAIIWPTALVAVNSRLIRPKKHWSRWR